MKQPGEEILPIGVRLQSDARFTGKGVTICFIDSEFYPHPDLVARRNRIKAIVDIPAGQTYEDGNFPPSNNISWHGTMTSVVCAGDGFLSDGYYKGIAGDAELVLLKVQNEGGRIEDDNIIKALEWVLHHHYQYKVRILNISLGAGEAVSYKQSRIDRLVEKLFEKDILVVAAVGNDEQGVVKAPANSPHVVSVGGVDDLHHHLYHSTYGKTADGFLKPELVAEAAWIAAPIAPGANEHTFVSPHYMHVDGTSFAAPIVSAVAAQLLEINPALTPSGLRYLLFSTAKRLPEFPAERQGFGMVQPRKATLKLLNRQWTGEEGHSPQLNLQQKTIGFFIRHECASQVTLAGSFNGWTNNELLLGPTGNGIWQIEIPMLPAGKYEYKFFVDDHAWVEDINNPYREPDGFNGFNSILFIEN